MYATINDVEVLAQLAIEEEIEESMADDWGIHDDDMAPDVFADRDYVDVTISLF